MERSISEIRKLAARFAESSDSPVDADKAERVLRAGHGCEFATAMFAQFRDTHEPWEEAELEELKTRVEQIVDQTPFLGAYLFARLYPVAARPACSRASASRSSAEPSMASSVGTASARPRSLLRWRHGALIDAHEARETPAPLPRPPAHGEVCALRVRRWCSVPTG